jgi:membrane protease YdiL (CAAX protease family)
VMMEMTNGEPLNHSAADEPRDRAMRWAFGSREQLSWAFALVLLRMAIFGAVLFGVLRPALTASEVPRTGSNAELLEHAILASLAIAFVGMFLFGVARVSLRDLGFSRERLGKNLALGVITFALGLVVVAVRSRIDGAPLAEAWQTVLGYSLRQRVELVFVAVHVVFGEEILFRGYLQPGLRARYSPAVAIGVTALIFALYHANFAPAAFAGNVVWGVIWGLVRERSRSTVPSSVAHFMNWSLLGWI